MEAAGVARRLANTPFDVVVTSDLERAAQTARSVIEAHENTPKLIVDSRLREVHLGDFEALPATQVHAEHPDLVKRWLDHPHTTRMPGKNAETLGEVQQRAWQVVTELREANPNRRIAFFTHTFVILTLVCKALDVDLTTFKKMFLHRASITKIHWGRHGATLVGFNDTSHNESLHHSK